MQLQQNIEPELRGRNATVKTVERVARILRGLAAGGTDGWRLTDLALHVGLGKPTLHRLLGALVENGLAYQDVATRLYRLGAATALLGASAARMTIASEARQSLMRLAAATGDSVFVSVQEGAAAICVGTEIGNFPIRTLTLNVGDRRPLGVGSGSLALLASLPEVEVEAAIARNKVWLKDYPRFDPDTLRALVREARAKGYALNQGRIVAAMSAVAVPVIGPDGRPIAAFAVAAITERIVGERLGELVALLRAEAANLAAIYDLNRTTQ